MTARFNKLNRMVAPAGTPVTVESFNLMAEVINSLVEVVESLIDQVDELGRVDESST